MSKSSQPKPVKPPRKRLGLGLITTIEIARLSGVSQPVVSKVLHGGSNSVRVGAATRARVIAIAEKHGYRTNLAAKAMRTGRFGSVTLVLSTQHHRSILPFPLLDSIMGALAQKNMHLTMARFPDEELVNEEFLPRILSSWMTDGLLVNYNANTPLKLIKQIEQHRIPSVWLNSKRTHNAVYPDEVEGGWLATRHLISKGHRRIAFLNYTGTLHFSAQDRYQGYVKAMENAGLNPVHWETAGLPPRSEVSYSLEQLRKKNRPTALICYVANEPWYVYEACRQLGIRVPDDISIVGFSDVIMTHANIQLSTMIVPEVTMGQLAVEALNRAIDFASDPQPSLKVPYVDSLTPVSIRSLS